MRTSHIATGLLAASAVLASTTMASAQQKTPTRTELMRVPVEGVEGKEGVFYRAEYPPGAVSPRHTHPGQEFIYVLTGSLVVEPDGGPPETINAGETATNPARRVHAARNPSASAPTRAIVFLLADKGQPLTTPAQ